MGIHKDRSSRNKEGAGSHSLIKIKLTSRAIVYDIPQRIFREMKEDLTKMNPEYISAKQQGRMWSLKTIPKWLYFFREIGGGDNNLSVPIGYLEEVFHYLSRNKLQCVLYDYRIEEPAELTFTGELRDFQGIACEDLEESENGTLEAPTGSGKTVMGLSTIASRSQKTLIIVHTKDLLFQWIERCVSFLDITAEEIGVIGNSQFRIGDRVTIGIINSLHKMSGEISNEFGQIVVDECHRTPGKTFSDTVDAFKAKYKTGLTATAERRDNLDDLIFWYLGPIRHTVEEEYLIEQGHILKPEVIMRSSSFVPVKDAKSHYTKMMTELVSDYTRNSLICGDVAKEMEEPDIHCLLLSDRKDHCVELQRIMLEDYGIECDVLTGDTKPEKRRELIEAVGEEQRPLIATGQLIGEGFDAKVLNTLFLTTPIKFDGRVTQYIGRVMRPAPGKERPLVYDYADWEIPQLRRSAHSRMKVYGRENIIQQ